MNSLISKPTSSIVKAMYTTHLLEQGKTDSVISSAVYGFKWAYIMNDLAVPTDSSIVNLLMETSKRIVLKPTKKKHVVTTLIFVSRLWWYCWFKIEWAQQFAL